MGEKVKIMTNVFPRIQGLRQTGNALVQTLLAAVVGGVLLVVGVQQYVEISANNKVEKTISEILVALAEYQIFGKLIAEGMSEPKTMAILKLPTRNQFGGKINLPATSSLATVLGPDGVLRLETSGPKVSIFYGGVPAVHCFRIVCVASNRNKVKVSSQQHESHSNITQVNPAYQCDGKQGLVDIFIAL
jgi:hypothetical protein